MVSFGIGSSLVADNQSLASNFEVYRRILPNTLAANARFALLCAAYVDDIQQLQGVRESFTAWATNCFRVAPLRHNEGLATVSSLDCRGFLHIHASELVRLEEEFFRELLALAPERAESVATFMRGRRRERLLYETIPDLVKVLDENGIDFHHGSFQATIVAYEDALDHLLNEQEQLNALNFRDEYDRLAVAGDVDGIARLYANVAQIEAKQRSLTHRTVTQIGGFLDLGQRQRFQQAIDRVLHVEIYRALTVSKLIDDAIVSSPVESVAPLDRLRREWNAASGPLLAELKELDEMRYTTESIEEAATRFAEMRVGNRLDVEVSSRSRFYAGLGRLRALQGTYASRLRELLKGPP